MREISSLTAEIDFRIAHKRLIESFQISILRGFTAMEVCRQKLWRVQWALIN